MPIRVFAELAHVILYAKNAGRTYKPLSGND